MSGSPRPDRELGQANVDENRFSYPTPPLARFTLRNPESPRAEALEWFDTSRPQSIEEAPAQRPHESVDSGQLHTEYRRLVAEQVAVRRVGTLIARGGEPSEVIGAVAEEMRRCVGAITAGIWRFDTSAEITLVAAAAHPAALAKWPVGTRTPMEGGQQL
jgi:hypothetical protein